jgi:pSer/pThr/pTyr-binding forkhead associated (FHA) protein
VSRHHATIVVDAFGARVRDNKSTNGTYVNDHRIREAQLKPGDLIKIGQSVFKYLA